MKLTQKNSLVVLIALAGILGAGLIAFKLNSIINETETLPRRPNLFLITLDTLRPDHLNIYGYSRETSPAISDLAKDSVVFYNAFTVATNSGPSHATMLTGLYPNQHGLIDNGEAIHPSIPTLASILKKKGYDTAGFVGYHALNEESGLNKGFQSFEFIPIVGHDHDEKDSEDDLKGFNAVNNWLKSRVQVDDKSPFFAWMHVQNIHGSYDPPAPYNTLYKEIPRPGPLKGFRGEFDVRCANDLAKAWRRGLFPSSLKDEVIALYDGEIRLVDDQLKIIFETLKAADIYDNTVIVILSDHGEVLFELYKNSFFKKGPGHTARYTDEGIRIPLIIKPAEVFQNDLLPRSNSLVSSIDLAPTLLDMLKIEPVSWMTGKSLIPLMKSPLSSSPDPKVFFHEYPYGTEFLGIRSEKWKLVIKNDEGKESKILIDLQNDPDENRNVLSENLQPARELEEILVSWKQKNQPVDMSVTKEMSEGMRQALIDGGYIRD
ncbi:MAG: arylsulfatase A-like enzyme [Nitrospinales bacterium]|jgi:arylsulfatase A-like enzyme